MQRRKQQTPPLDASTILPGDARSSIIIGRLGRAEDLIDGFTLVVGGNVGREVKIHESDST